MAFRSVEIANEFIQRASDDGKPVTNMQLQKLVYFAHGWSLAIFGEALTEDDPQAWDNGPVYRELWEHLRNSGRNPITSKISQDELNPFKEFIPDFKPSAPYEANLSGSQTELLDLVWKKYGSYDAFRLSDMTHQRGTPWDKTYFSHGKNAIIPKQLIEEHYLKLGGTKSARKDAREEAVA